MSNGRWRRRLGSLNWSSRFRSTFRAVSVGLPHSRALGKRPVPRVAWTPTDQLSRASTGSWTSLALEFGGWPPGHDSLTLCQFCSYRTPELELLPLFFRLARRARTKRRCISHEDCGLSRQAGLTRRAASRVAGNGANFDTLASWSSAATQPAIIAISYAQQEEKEGPKWGLGEPLGLGNEASVTDLTRCMWIALLASLGCSCPRDLTPTLSNSDLISSCSAHFCCGIPSLFCMRSTQCRD